MSWKRPVIIRFPVVKERRGNLGFIEGNTHVPFEIKRVYYLYDVPGGTTRGGHAHFDLQQVILALSGSFDVVVDNGKTRSKFTLNRSYHGLFLPRMVWREIENFSSGSICLVLASEKYLAKDYIRSYKKFRELTSSS